jgi:hypothetical protein
MSIANDLERAMLDLINGERSARGLDELALELDLNAAAEDHSRWMLDTDTFNHTGKDGSSPADRMREAGFELSGSAGTAENIAIQSIRGAAGFDDDVVNLHESLMNSPLHRANILNPRYDYIGIGIEAGGFEYSGFPFELPSIVVTQKFAFTGASVTLDLPAPEPETPPAPAPAPEPEPTPEPLPEPEPERDPTPEPTPEPEPHPEPGQETDETPEPGPSTQPEPAPEPEPEPSPEPEPEPETDETPAYAPAAEPEISTTPTDGDDVLQGDAEANTIDGLGGHDLLDGGAGDDRLIGKGGRDTLDGGAGDDHLRSGWSHDLLRGGDGRDHLWAGKGQDMLDGGAGNDWLWGESGHDTLDGGTGADTLQGGLGNDLLTGGAGADVFVFELSAGGADADIVTDFTRGEDRIWIRAELLGVAEGALDLSYAEFGSIARQDDTRLLYDKQTGAVRIDVDGRGGAEAELLFTFEGGDRPHADDVLLG